MSSQCKFDSATLANHGIMSVENERIFLASTCGKFWKGSAVMKFTSVTFSTEQVLNTNNGAIARNCSVVTIQ